MQRLTVELRFDGGNDLRMTVPDIKDTEAAEAIEVFFPVDVAIAIGARIAPFNNGARAFDVGCFAVFEKSRVYMVAKIFDRFARNPRCLVGRNRGRLDKV